MLWIKVDIAHDSLFGLYFKFLATCYLRGLITWIHECLFCLHATRIFVTVQSLLFVSSGKQKWYRVQSAGPLVWAVRSRRSFIHKFLSSAFIQRTVRSHVVVFHLICEMIRWLGFYVDFHARNLVTLCKVISNPMNVWERNSFTLDSGNCWLLPHYFVLEDLTK